MNAAAQAALRSWSAPLGVDLALCAAAVIYARGWFRMRFAFPGLVSPRRFAAFIAGIIFVWVAIGSPLNAFDDALLTVHMMQHLLLMSVAPALILLGAPQLALLHGLPQFVARKIVGPLLRWSLVKRLERIAGNPAFCWLAATVALIGWHIPAVFELALRWNWLHELEHSSFLGAGLLFWWPVIQPWPSVAHWPRWSIPLYLFCATLPCDALSAFLAFCDRVVYPSYISAPRMFAWSPLADQQCAAAMMWVAVTIILVIPAIVVTMRILAPQEAASSQEAFARLRGIAIRALETSAPEVS
ncbi:MAG TPA: cytochrome c oxidase assembly protein [Candidatus Acidoferrales bacterium]|jgi:cytochrome c oxidase assembly factor CtaG|nr:cytochrome c oxidase assembly protein [Candidatus Acidoferrales bacterium]